MKLRTWNMPSTNSSAGIEGLVMQMKTNRVQSLAGLLVGMVAGLLSLTVAHAHDFGGSSTGGGASPNKPQPPCEASDDNCTCPMPRTGNPVLLFDGSERLEYEDIVVRGTYPIKLHRRYSSQSTYDNALGYGWAFDHDRRLFEYPDGSVIQRTSGGILNKFTFTGGAYSFDRDNLSADLTENPDGTFELRYRNGRRDVYDAEGRLILEENSKGQQHEFLYDVAGKLPLVGTSPYAVDPNTAMTVAYLYQLTKIQERGKDGVLTGYFIDFSYDATTGRLTQITANDGRSVGYLHDDLNGLTRGNLVQVTGLENIVQAFGYSDPNDAHNLTSIQDHAGATPIVNTYDAQDRVIQQDYGTHLTTFDYVIDYGKTVVTDTIVDDQGLNPYTAVTTFEYDEAGYLTKMTDALGHETRHIYDANKDPIRTEIWQNELGVLSLLQAKDFTYDGMSRKLSESTTLDSGEIVSTTWTYDNGWVASEETVSSIDPLKLFRTEYTFHRDGNGHTHQYCQR